MFAPPPSTLFTILFVLFGYESGRRQLYRTRDAVKKTLVALDARAECDELTERSGHS